MKKLCIYIAFLLAVSVNGCGDTKITQKQENGEIEGTSTSSHLELEKLENYAPVFCVTLKKTGENELAFDEDVQVTVEPDGQAAGVWYQVDSDENTLWVSFWNAKNGDSVKIMADELEYEFEIPKYDSKVYSLDKMLSYNGDTALLNEVQVYSNAVSLHLQEISDWDMFDNNFLLKYNGEVYPPYEHIDEDNERTFLYVFEDGITVDEMNGIEIGVPGKYEEIQLDFM